MGTPLITGKRAAVGITIRTCTPPPPPSFVPFSSLSPRHQLDTASIIHVLPCPSRDSHPQVEPGGGVHPQA